MSQSNPLKGVSSIVVLRATESGFRPVKVQTDSETSRSTSKKLRPFEKILIRTIRAHAKATTDYLDRHESSSSKKKNGWAKDLLKNSSKSVKSGIKVLKPFKFKLF